MSLTAGQATKVRRYLGYPDVNRELHSALEGAMTALSAEGEAEVVATLDQLATIETRLASSWSRQAVVKAEEVTLAGAAEIGALRSEGTSLASVLATLLGVEMRGSPFNGAPGGGAGIAGRG